MKLTPVDSKAEIEGSNFVYRGVTFLVARANNSKYKKLFRELIKPVKNEFDKGRLDEETAEGIMHQAFAETILVGWKNFLDMDKKEWEYSTENALALLKDDNDAYEAISEFSEDIDNYIINQEVNLKGK